MCNRCPTEVTNRDESCFPVLHSAVEWNFGDTRERGIICTLILFCYSTQNIFKYFAKARCVVFIINHKVKKLTNLTTQLRDHRYFHRSLYIYLLNIANISETYDRFFFPQRDWPFAEKVDDENSRRIFAMVKFEFHSTRGLLGFLLPYALYQRQVVYARVFAY